MRFLIILFLTSLLNCIDKEKNDQKLVKNNTDIQTNIDCNDFILKVDIDKEDFNVVNKGDTIFIYKELYGSIESKRVSIIEKENKLSNLEVSESIENGFYQRMTDDNKSFALNIFYNTTNKPKLASNEFISSDSENFKSVLLEQHFFDVKKESLKKQNKFYKNLLENKKDYEDCCPEYIEQAKNFLKKKDESFKNFDSLNISPFINKNIITIKYSIKKVFKRKTIVLSEEKEEKKDDFIIQNSTNKISDKQTIALPKGFYILDSTMINLKTRNYKILTLEKEEIKNKDNAQHNSNPIVILEKTNNKYFEKSSNYDLVFKYDDNCPADGYGGIVSKNNYFTIQQIFCMDFLFVNSYTTFKVDENTNTIYLHKYGEEYTNRSNPDEKIPTRIWTTKDFGNVNFENVTENFLKGLRKNNPKN